MKALQVLWNVSQALLWVVPWTNFSWQDEPLAEFSTLGVAACHTMHLLHSIAIQPILELKIWPKQLLGYLPLDIALPGCASFGQKPFGQRNLGLWSYDPSVVDKSSLGCVGQMTVGQMFLDQMTCNLWLIVLRHWRCSKLAAVSVPG